MSGANVTNLIVGVAVVALLVSRQLMGRRLNENYRLSVILAIVAVLWIVSLAVHLGYDELVAGHVAGANGGNVGDATIVLYLMITLAVQQFLLLARVRRQEAAGDVPARY